MVLEGTILRTATPVRLQNLLLNRLQVTPKTATALIHKYLVDVRGPDGSRIHPTRTALVPAQSTVQLPQLRLAQRPAPLVPEGQPGSERFDVLRTLSFRDVRRRLRAPLAEPVRILHADGDLVVVNKPYGLLGDEGVFVAAVQQRLSALSPLQSPHPSLLPIKTNYTDKEVTGVCLYARSHAAKERLEAALADSQVDPRVQLVYWALCTSVHKASPFGELHSLHYRGRDDHRRRFQHRPRHTSHLTLRRELLGDKDAVAAITQWRHISTHIRHRAAGLSRRKLGLYELRPLTLRPDQLRVQLAEQLKCPVVGDWLYGPTAQRALRQPVNAPLHLHLYQVRLSPGLLADRANSSNSITAPIPPHFVMAMNKFPLFLPTKPQLRKPKFRSTVKKLVRRHKPGSNSPQ